ncbi:MAG: SIMPL domain-containing protein [Candidatus Gracilibacteria bacterium]|nr:SIMPL domain-containing protein [Candidatus Gracilibacteria bacterium]
MLEKILGIISVVLLFFIIGTNLVTNNNKNPRTISLTVEGTTKAVPNSAKISINLTTESKESAEVATQKLINSRNSLVSALKNLGLNDSDILLNGMNTNQWDDYSEADENNNEKKIRVYNTMQYLTLNITKENFGNIENILTVLGKNDDVTIMSIDKNLDSNADLIESARKNAIEKAKKEASEMAQNLDAKLGKIISVTTDSQNYTPYMGSLANIAKSSEEVTTADAQWFKGEDEYTTTLSFTFELR